MDRWAGGWMDGWMDGWMIINIFITMLFILGPLAPKRGAPHRW